MGVNSPSLHEPAVLQSLRDRMSSFRDFDRVVVDDTGDTLWLICRSELDRDGLLRSARDELVDLGLAADQIRVEVLVRAGNRERKRVRFEGMDCRTLEDGNVRVAVHLEWGGETFNGETVGEPGNAIEQRTAAQAAFEALREIVPELSEIRLVGIKQVRAFDAELTVAALYRTGRPPLRYVGAVLTGADTRRAAALAVLAALNRMLGNYLVTA